MERNGCKALACKLLGMISVLFLFGLVGAVVEGSCSWAAGLVLGALCLIVLNSVCGALLPAAEQMQQAAAAPSAASPLRVLRGGKAA